MGFKRAVGLMLPPLTVTVCLWLSEFIIGTTTPLGACTLFLTGLLVNQASTSFSSSSTGLVVFRAT